MAVTASDTLNMRIKPEDRSLLEWAAMVSGKTRTDFVLDAVRQAAQATLLDRALIQVSPETYAVFLERLDNLPPVNARLQKTMQTKAPWD